MPAITPVIPAANVAGMDISAKAVSDAAIYFELQFEFLN
jgi:hypothetical protein